jgi:hypothetical protein
VVEEIFELSGRVIGGTRRDRQKREKSLIKAKRFAPFVERENGDQFPGTRLHVRSRTESAAQSSSRLDVSQGWSFLNCTRVSAAKPNRLPVSHVSVVFSEFDQLEELSDLSQSPHQNFSADPIDFSASTGPTRPFVAARMTLETCSTL